MHQHSPETIEAIQAELEKAREEIKLLKGSVDFGVKCNDDLQEQLTQAQLDLAAEKKVREERKFVVIISTA